MERYFPQSTNGVDKEALVEHFLKEYFDNKEDAHQMTILYFIHTFINSQLNASPVPLSDVKMVENGKYEFFSWGKVSFSGLMASRGHKFFVEKQFYKLGGIPHVLNVWMFEHCSNVDTKVAVKEDTEEKSKVDADSTCINRKELLVKADLDSLESEIKTYVKTYIDQKFNDLERLMNDRFSEVLKSLQLKNETVEKEKVAKQSPKEGQHSDDVADFEDHSNPISPHFVSEKTEKMEDDGKLSDIVVEKMQPLDSIIPGREHDMTLRIYKPPPTTPDEDMISDTTILSVFPTQKKDVSDVKKTSAPRSRKPSKIYRSPF
ncbi:hypothetical protein CQW23_13258 [Capsicum baccatum]|uniref:DUF1985 domain-containing protein n=1 Tax=Capsicum baccatum TaxID=33114 RepID=A0A2G2WV45_CAPBA|nr:hypothetical protein CQW23_13258 [Capsicum baccatum]